MAKKPILVILDRDGVINYDSKEYIKSADEWLPIEGSLEAIARLNRAEILVAVATNQRGIALELLDHNALNAIHSKFKSLLSEHHGWIDRIEYCTADDNAHPDRKPNPGMLLKLIEHYHLENHRDRIYFIGDKLADITAGERAGIQPLLVRTGNGAKTAAGLEKPFTIPVFDTLADCINSLLTHETTL